MTIEQNFKEEFPRVYRMFHEPKKFGPDVVVGFERRFRKLLLWLIKLLIAYVVIATLWQIHQSVGMVDSRPSEWIVRNWVVGRNFLFLLTFVSEVPLLIFSFIIQALRGRIISAAKLVLTGILLLNLIIFSYALAGLAVDLVFVFAGMWSAMLQSDMGAAVRVDPEGLIRGIGR